MQFKKSLIILCALLIAFVAAEIVVSQAIRYPHYTGNSRKFQIHNKLGPYNTVTWRPPFYKFWSVEGGNRVYRYNNLGLPGSDLKLPLKNNNIFVMGSSYIEAMNVSNNATSTAVFQRMLDNAQKSYQVINLGCSGHDTYVEWFRSQFFQSKINPELVIVVIDPSSMGYLSKRWNDSLSFEMPKSLPIEFEPAGLIRYTSELRQYSAMINLTVQGFASRNNVEDNAKEVAKTEEQSALKWSKLEQTFKMFKESYHDRLMIISIIPDIDVNNRIREICSRYNCNFSCNESILQPENRVNGNGHLNENGNMKLGKLMHESFIKLKENY